MARTLIGAAAVADLRAVEPVGRRRRVVARLSSLEPPVREHGLCAPGRFRMIVEGLRVLYARREDGTLVIIGMADLGDAVDSTPELPDD